MNFDRMRALLLDQAIRGELVPQLAEEGAVEIGAIAPEAFKLPKTWKWLTLKSLVIPTKQIIPEESFTYLDVSSIKKFQIDEIKRLDPSNAPSRARKVVQPGMVLFATVRPYLKNICVSPELPGQVIASTAFATMTCSKDLNNRYLFYFLRSDFFMDLVKSKQRGISYPAISEKDFYALPVPVPPLDEQIRIVAKLDEAITEIDRAEKAYQELQTLSGVLRGQILQEAIQGKLVPQLDSEEEVEQIGDVPKEVPFDIPEKWKWYSAKDVYQLLSGRDLTKSEILEIQPNEQSFPYITGASQIHDSSIVINRWTKECVVKSQIGDLLLTCKGTVGKTAINTVGDLHIARQIMALRPNKSVMSVAFLRLFIDTLSKRLAREAKSMIPGIDRKALMSKPVPVPPLQEQKRIVEMVEELFKQVEALSSK